jgi:hypothetical protein
MSDSANERRELPLNPPWRFATGRGNRSSNRCATEENHAPATAGRSSDGQADANHQIKRAAERKRCGSLPRCTARTTGVRAWKAALRRQRPQDERLMLFKQRRRKCARRN